MGKKLGLQRELTTRERSILDYIRKKTWEDGFPPRFVKFVQQLACVLHPPSMDICHVFLI